MGINAYLAGHTDLQHQAWMVWLEKHKIISVDRRPRPPGLTREQAIKLNLAGRQAKIRAAQQQVQRNPAQNLDAIRKARLNKSRQSKEPQPPTITGG
jgi:hypothetical protein